MRRRSFLVLMLLILCVGLVCFLVPLEFFGQSLSKVQTTEKVVALTFDDGPNPPYTQALVNLLKKTGVRATFYMVGRNIEMHRNAALEVQAAGHELGNHGYSHEMLRFAFPWRIESEVEKTDRLIQSLGYRQAISFRAPFGITNLSMLFALWRLKKQHIGYAIESTDYLRPDPEVMFQKLRAQIEPGVIIVLHDGEGIRTETLILTEKLIEYLKISGYRFLTVSELLHLSYHPGG